MFERSVEKTERNISKHEHTVGKRIKSLVTNQDTQCTYRVKMRRF
jgi:hypothetical protein